MNERSADHPPSSSDLEDLSESLVGSQVGQYSIEKLVGEGAMGHVYLAEDTRLHRPVALKFLADEMSNDPDRLERFENEARAIAGLNHPNIVTLHAIEDSGAAPYLVMEFVAGKTLDAIIPESGLPTTQLLDYSIALSDALAAAHEAGVIHRDLKPTNVMIGDSGRVKILDFGLAKLSFKSNDKELTRQDTRAGTSDGLLIGTVPYMSPEQVHGRKLDQRSDIFSVGTLLYRMSTGTMPFEGGTIAELISSILRDDPNKVAEQRRDLPRDLSRIVRRCLHKDPERRYQTAKDLRNDLVDLRHDIETGEYELTAVSSLAPSTKARPWSSWLGGALAGLLLAAALIPLALRTWSSAPPAEIGLQRIVSFAVGGGFYESPEWSPDGQWLVYAQSSASDDDASGLDLWKRDVRGGRPIQLTTSLGVETNPDWSPDGRMIAFDEGGAGGIHVIHSEGGTSVRLHPAGRHPKWSPDGSRILFDIEGDIHWIPHAGGEPTLVQSGTENPYAIWAPLGDHILFWDMNQASDIVVAALDGSSKRAFSLVPPGEEVGGLALSSAGDRLIFSKGPYGGNKNLYEVPFDADALVPTGPVRSLLLSPTQDVQVALSADGSQIAYTARDVERHLYRIDFDPQSGLPDGEPTKLTSQAPDNLYPVVSLDGSSLVWTAQSGGQGLLYTSDLQAGQEVKLTHEWGNTNREVQAGFGPEGSIIYSSTLGGSYELWRLPAPASLPLPLTETNEPTWDSSPTWCAYLGRIVFESSRGDGTGDLWQVEPRAGAVPEPLLDLGGSQEMQPTCSPSGRQLAFRSDKRGTKDIWLLDLESGESSALEHPAEEAWAAWTADETWFFFSSNRSGAFNVWAQRADDARPGTPDAVPFTTYDGPSFGLPETGMLTKFALGPGFVILPLEQRSSRILVLAPETS